MSGGRDEIQGMSKMLTVWQLVGIMGLDGRLTLNETKVLTESLVVWASYVRNQGNKTWTARELGRSRRIIRSILQRWEGTGEDSHVLPLSFRRWVLEESNPPVLEVSARVLQVDVEHEIRTSRRHAVPRDENELPMSTPPSLPLLSATTNDD